MLQILRVIFRYCPERESFLFPPGAEVTIPCLSATLLGNTTVSRLVFLGKLSWRSSLNNFINLVPFVPGRMVIRLGIGSEELAFMSTLALLSPNALNVGFLPAHTAMLHDIEAKVLVAFRGYMRQRWSARPYLVGRCVALLSDIRALQHSIPLQVWLEPVDSSSQSSWICINFSPTIERLEKNNFCIFCIWNERTFVERTSAK